MKQSFEPFYIPNAYGLVTSGEGITSNLQALLIWNRRRCETSLVRVPSSMETHNVLPHGAKLLDGV
jgi:lantibiotic modifying enzyme